MTKETQLPQEQAKDVVRLVRSFTGMTRVKLAELAEIKRPNLVGWLNDRNGISEPRMRAVLRALHIPNLRLEEGCVHRWKVPSWKDAKELLDLVLTDQERQCLEIFHVQRADGGSGTAILRCAYEEDVEEFLPMPRYLLIVLQLENARAKDSLTPRTLGYGVVRPSPLNISSPHLSEIDFQQLALRLAHSYSEPDSVEDSKKGVFEDLIEEGSAECREVAAMAIQIGMDNLRFAVRLIREEPALLAAIKRALEVTDGPGLPERLFRPAQLTQWVRILVEAPALCVEMNKVMERLNTAGSGNPRIGSHRGKQ